MAVSKFRMSDAEIMDFFDAATDKDKAVDALAVKCRTTRQVMRDYLSELGIALEAPEQKQMLDGFKVVTPKKKGGRPAAPMDELRAMELFKEGYDDIAMSEALGISVKRVQAWRSRMHLKRPQGRPKKSTEEEAESVESLHAMDPATGKETVIEAAQAAAEPAPPEPENEAEELTTGGFIQLLMQLTNSRTLTKPLVINGSRVNGISRLIIDGSGDAMTVKVETC